MAVVVMNTQRVALGLNVGRASMLLACTFTLSCARRTVELSTPPKVQPSSEPTVVGSIHEQVGSLTVDAERLYWSGRFAISDPYDSGNTGAALHSCNKANCAASLVTYDSSLVDTTSGFAVRDGNIYWVQLKSWEGPSSFQLVSCPIEGCNGAPSVAYVEELGDFHNVAYGPDAFYFSSGPTSDIQRLPYKGGGQPEDIIKSTFATGGSSGLPSGLTVNGDYLYLFVATPPYVTLKRARTDGSSQLDTVADRLEILERAAEPYAALSPYLNLAFDSEYVYWTSNTLTGSIQRCPLSGCATAPEVLTGAIRAPTALRLDGKTAYFQYFDSTLGNSLTRCTLPNCEPAAPIVSGLDDGNVVAIDDRYVYTASSPNPPTADATWAYPEAQIRRFPK